MKTSFHPLTPDRWDDLVTLFGARGACGGCWCLAWRVPPAEFAKIKGEGAKKALKKLVASGSIPGILAYDGTTPIGWCAVAPRGEYVRLGNSKILAPVDGRPVWSIPCLFIAKGYRRKGVSTGLLRAAIDQVKKRKGAIVEGYPFDIREKLPDAFVWMGLMPSFVRAGFVEVARRSRTRPIMRYDIEAEAGQRTK
jgi:GNAT superfamily N-acetyltransferase